MICHILEVNGTSFKGDESGRDVLLHSKVKGFCLMAEVKDRQLQQI